MLTGTSLGQKLRERRKELMAGNGWFVLCICNTYITRVADRACGSRREALWKREPPDSPRWTFRSARCAEEACVSRCVGKSWWPRLTKERVQKQQRKKCEGLFLNRTVGGTPEVLSHSKRFKTESSILATSSFLYSTPICH